jgi:hypothetical protein
VRDLSYAHGVPLELPLGPDGRVLRECLPSAAIATWEGVLGHYHVTRTKVDPGPLELDTLARRWRG